MTNPNTSVKIHYAVQHKYGGIAQLARARGSYPRCPRFESWCRYQTKAQRSLRLLYGPLVKRSRHRPFTAVTWVRFPYGSPKIKASPIGEALIFAYLSRESKGAVVNDMPVACQSRDPARPQARIPVRVTKNKKLCHRQSFLFLVTDIIRFAQFSREWITIPSQSHPI